LAAAVVALEVWMPGATGPGGQSLVARLASLGCITVALALPFRWRVRVDEHGVARRRVLGWTQWTWAELESGCVLKKFGMRLVHPHRPWWSRSLDLMWLGGARSDEVMDLINTRYRLPPAPPIPAVLQLELGRGTRFTADHQGLRITTRKRDERFAWSEVSAIWIRRHDPKRRDFANVRIALPTGAQPLDLPLQPGGADWRDPPREVVSEFLLRHAAQGCVRERLTGAPLESEDRTTLEHWLLQAKKSYREWRNTNLVMFILLLSLLIWMAIGIAPALAAFQTGLFVFLLGPIVWGIHRAKRSNIERLAAALNAGGRASGSDSTSPSGP